MNKENSLIIGEGEVGIALYKVLSEDNKNTYIRDIKEIDVPIITWLHICYPYNKKFVSITKEYIRQYKPKYTIIHSTVKVGTTRKLGKNVWHSPVRGLHPNLDKGILVFTKYLGGEYNEEVIDYFRNKNIKIIHTPKPETTELGKILDTSYYGWNIIFCKEVKKLCNKYKVDFNIVYKDMNESYNEGYKKLRKDNVIRPVLIPPLDSGLKGHCILENSIILKEMKESFISENILKMGKSIDTISEEKPYLNKTWFYCEHWGKKRTLTDIGKQFKTSSENIGQIAKRRKWLIRTNKWKIKDIYTIIRLYKKGKNFKEISDFLENKDYTAIRNLVYTKLKLKSNYNPSEETKKLKNRKKISAALQHINIDDWNGFKETKNSLIRKSIKYQKWRTKIFQRDNFACRLCGMKSGNEKTVILHAHHIKPFSKNKKLIFDINNGITLCKECHHKKHFKRFYLTKI